MKTLDINKKLSDNLTLSEIQGYEENVGNFKEFQFFELLIDVQGHKDYFIVRINREQLILFDNKDELEVIQFPFSEGEISDEMYEFEIFENVFNVLYRDKKFFVITKNKEVFDIIDSAIIEIMNKYETQGFDL